MQTMSEGERYQRGRARFLEVHDEKALRSVTSLRPTIRAGRRPKRGMQAESSDV
jgi:hypothetical protein